MAKHYLSVAEYIKKRPFDVYVPAYYHPFMPEELVSPKKWVRPAINTQRMTDMRPRPNIHMRPIIDPDQLQLAKYTIEIMLDMFQKKVEFIIPNQSDIPEIFDTLDRYLISLEDNIRLGEESAIAYARLVVSWRKEVYKHYFRYMKQNPTAMAQLYPNNDPNNNFMSLLCSFSGVFQERMKADPIRAREAPPYDVEKAIPQSKQTPVDKGSFSDSALGLPKTGFVDDDGRDFDFDGFLGRR